MKRKTAKEILAVSFRELAEKKKADKITVRDIAENCGYSTTTFYRHFKDKYDLIAWEYTQNVSEIMNRVGQDGYSWNQTLYEGYDPAEHDGVAFEDLPDDWRCPRCKQPKEKFNRA